MIKIIIFVERNWKIILGILIFILIAYVCDLRRENEELERWNRINEAGLREVGKWEDCVAKKGMDWCIDSGYFD